MSKPVLRAGSFDNAKPDWRGVIRADSYPWYVCYHHDHDNAASARECARAALEWMKANPKVMPDKWITYTSFKEIWSK
jgi:hypothetical protein